MYLPSALPACTITPSHRHFISPSPLLAPWAAASPPHVYPALPLRPATAQGISFDSLLPRPRLHHLPFVPSTVPALQAPLSLFVPPAL